MVERRKATMRGKASNRDKASETAICHGTVSQYNRDQKQGFLAIGRIFSQMSGEEQRRLRDLVVPYLDFRRRLDAFNDRWFGDYCPGACFRTGLSACCGFESIIIFFADQVISLLESRPGEMERTLRALENPRSRQHCVFLGRDGCLWRVRPITCAMYYCDPAKNHVFGEFPQAGILYSQFREEEREFTRPVKPVLFDTIEKIFIERGVKSPLMWFHRSPGLLRLKRRYGVE